MKNLDIRQYANDNHICLWEIAYSLGVTDATFSRKLRIELSDDEKANIYSIIDKLSAEKFPNVAAK